jgi:hypothetical protein
MGLYVLDAELASMYHAPPNLRHPGNRHYFTCAKEVFDAPDAVSWARAMVVHHPSSFTVRQYFNDRSQSAAMGTLSRVSSSLAVPDPDDEFTLYIILLGIQAQVCEARELETLFASETQHEVTALLLSWYDSYCRWRTIHHGNGSSPFCLIILWHSIFVTLLSNVNELEIAFGSKGATAAANQAESVAHWAVTPEAKRAALHAIRIRQLLSGLSLSTVPPIHLPRIAFQTAIVCWSYIRFKPMSPTPQAADDWHDTVPWREFGRANLNTREMQRELNRIRDGWGSDQPLGPFSEILQRLGQWGLSKKLGDILNVAIHEETDMH